MGDGESYREDTLNTSTLCERHVALTASVRTENARLRHQLMLFQTGLVHELESNEVLAYPNPTNGFVTVELKAASLLLESI